ncbi:DUF3784 domain-containing protein [Alteribacter keqinensis]|uniref:DUF3784 domain-containing protein n=1 Tax=Alteribacter keqinensis TaxID=2483800 RepID=A0A3M7TY49_9BACI|nr:DUF3784 domain-containing protein [Alteribacter keqinensis]RNA70199.1 DUF3784 domain-containing protein [Alteribacter keqinensis]
MLIAITIQLFSFLIIWIPAYFIYKKGVYMLLSGFNTKPEEEQQRLIENGYPQAVGKAMMNSSYILLAGAVLAFFVEPDFAVVVSWLVWMLYLFIRLITLSKLDNSKTKKRNLSILIGAMVFSIILVAVVFLEGEREPRFTVSDQSVAVSGRHGVEWSLEEITDIDLVGEVPEIRSKMNGYSFMERRRGHFSIEGLGRGRLFVHTGTPPFLYLERDDDFLFVNSKDPAKTEQWFQQVRGSVE